MFQKGVDGYPYMKHLTYLWPGYWEYHFCIMNEVLYKTNKFTLEGGLKVRHGDLHGMSSEIY